MASHVVVIDASAKRATIKTQPGTYLSDVLDEACKKLKLSPELYALKYNKKPVDLSRTFRLSGLPSGAQLELVQASKSATVVNVALQLPASENNRRLTEKFPSTTSLWQILRQLETKNSLNFTQRGTPQAQDGGGGSGRLYYEMPVIDALGRQMGSFVDLQKSLSQLGITSGSALLRLSFKSSGKPLEEAMLEISQYFKEVEEPVASGAHAKPLSESHCTPGVEMPVQPDAVAGEPNLSGRDEVEGLSSTAQTGDVESQAANINSEPERQEKTDEVPVPVSPTGRRAQLYYAPTSSRPRAASIPHNDADYVPGIEHAQLHQARLSKEGRNKRLLSDAEIAAQEQEKQSVLSKITAVKTRIRLPDQDAIVIDFNNEDTGADVYTEVRSRMQYPAAPFRLMYYSEKGQHQLLEDGPKKLISQLGWRGSMQVNMLWDDSVPASVRSQPCLSEEWRSQRQHAAAPEQPLWQDIDQDVAASSKGKEKESSEKKVGVEEKMKRFLGLTKKK